MSELRRFLKKIIDIFYMNINIYISLHYIALLLILFMSPV